jgi:hypothetical protein
LFALLYNNGIARQTPITENFELPVQIPMMKTIDDKSAAKCN